MSEYKDTRSGELSEGLNQAFVELLERIYAVTMPDHTEILTPEPEIG